MTNLTSSLYNNIFPVPGEQTESETSSYNIIVISNVIRKCISKKTHISENLIEPSTSKVSSKCSETFPPKHNFSKDYTKKFTSQHLKERISKAMRARWADPEWKEKQLKAYKKGWASQGAIEKKSKVSRVMWADPEWREKQLKANQARWADPEWKEKQLKAYKQGWAKQEVKEKKSKAIRARWADPEWKEKQSKAIRARWADPEWKEKQLKAIRARWADPEWREKQLKAYKKGRSSEEAKEKKLRASVQRNPEMLELSRQRADEAIASILGQVVEIKVEPREDPLLQGNPELQIIGHSTVTHEINNSLPILQDPNNPTHSLFKELEGSIGQIKISRYGDLQLSSSQKKQMLEEVKEWLKVNEQDKEAYQKKFEELFEINIPIDIGPDRGRSVYAKQNIKKFQVVGPYAGILYKNEEELQRSMRQKGSYNVLSYLFGTRSKYRTIDAFNAGNTTSLINTGQLPGTSMWKENNLSIIQVGKNLNFYVANRDISHGEELLTDYGPDYNPMHLIKVEPEDPQEEYFE